MNIGLIRHASTQAVLPSRALVEVSGAGARDFLQGLVSNDMRRVTESNAVYAALLSPQGKFLFDFIVLAWGDGVALECAAARADELVKRLNMYRLRSPVTIARVENVAVAARWEQPGEPGKCVRNGEVLEVGDPRLAALGTRLIGPSPLIETLCAAGQDDASYDAHRLALGVPDGVQDLIPDRSLLMECGFEALHGVDFHKGCYVGQEVTARSKHRAQLRKHLHMVRGGAELPAAGTEMTQAGKVVGEMRSHRGVLGLAMIQFDAVRESETGTPLECDGQNVQAALAPWMDKTLASVAD